MRPGALWLVCLVASSTLQAQDAPESGCLMRSRRLGPNDVLAQFGWRDLRTGPLPATARRELRLHHGGGLALPEYALRIVESGDSAYGDLVAHWPTAGATEVLGDSACRARREAEERMIAGKVTAMLRERHGCLRLVSAPFMDACRVRFAASPAWMDLLARSDSLGIWAYRRSVPWRVRGLDGVRVSVELRDSTGYRELAYHNPGSGDSPGEREVEALNSLLLELLRRPPPPP